MRISRQPSPVQNMKDQKQLKNVEYFHCLGSIINDARCTREIKSRISMAKTAFNKTKTPFTSKMELRLRKKLATCYVGSIAFVWCWNLDAAENRSEISGNFWNVVLQKVREDELDRSCEKWRSMTKSQRGKEIPYTIKRRKAKLIGHIWRRNFILNTLLKAR
jgi:hypothetical protein